MPLAMELRSPTRHGWLALLISVLAGGCGTRPLDATDARPTPGTDAAVRTDLVVLIDTNDGGGAPDTGVVDTNDGGGAPDVGQDGGDAGDAPAPTPPRNDLWIYVATANGVERINLAGGPFMPFGMAGATRSVFPSPNGKLIAQELADHRVAVFADDNSLRTRFDVRPGLLGWSDDSTLLFSDPHTLYLQQTNIDGTTRRYVPIPPGLNAYGHRGAMLSPDRTLLLAAAAPPASNPGQYLQLVLSAVDGTLVLNLGVLSRGGAAWTGDGRLVVASTWGSGYIAVSPRSGATTPVANTSMLDAACGYTSWFESGKILLGRFFSAPGSDTGTCIPAAMLDVDTGATSAPGPVIPPTNSSGLGVAAFAQSADGHDAVVASGSTLELGAVASSARRPLGTASGAIVAVGWAHPSGGTANLVALPRPPGTAIGLAGAPSVASRSGGADCRTGVWVNRTPNQIPAGWPVLRRAFGSTFDADRGTLLVEGGFVGNVYELPSVAYETMEWNGAAGQWSNLSRPDGFGPTSSRPLAYDSSRKVILALGANLPGDGPWSWTAEFGWKNLRAPGQVYDGPSRTNGAASVYDAGRDRWIVSGGYSDTATWEWNGAAWQKSAAPPPGGTTQLAGSRLVYDGKRAVVYSVGNRDRGSAPWLYEPAQSRWTAQPSSGPSPLPREWAGVAYDERRDRVMVFGGFALNGTGGGNTFGDLAEWDPASGAWQSCPATGAAPTARTNAALAYDRTRDVLVLFGGESSTGGAAMDVWEWYVP
jgi:hypothetical protein